MIRRVGQTGTDQPNDEYTERLLNACRGYDEYYLDSYDIDEISRLFGIYSVDRNPEWKIFRPLR